jgi:hypothetical protein
MRQKKEEVDMMEESQDVPIKVSALEVQGLITQKWMMMTGSSVWKEQNPGCGQILWGSSHDVGNSIDVS